MTHRPSLKDNWTLGPLRVPNRVLLAPLAGIGNWFVRLQAKRYGAGMAVSEMVSSHAIFHGNERTCKEMLRIDEREREVGPERRPGGIVSIQLFGQEPDVMRVAAREVARAGADAIDLNMGCPVPKVCKTGSGAALLDDPDVAVAVARAAREGSGLPVTVKLRSGRRPGEESGFELAHRLVGEAGVAAIAFHPRSAAVHHKGVPDYELAARLVQTLDAPVILTGGLHDAPATLAAFERTGAAAVMLARGSLGNPWLFERLLAPRGAECGSEREPRGDLDHERERDLERRLEHEREPGLEPTRVQVLAELDWIVDRAVEHLGAARAGRYLRKFYPWYVARLGLERPFAKELGESLQRAAGPDDARYTAALAAA
jgi:tRNA-dihydrouridine synthase B